MKQPDDRSRRRFLQASSLLGLAVAFSPGTTGEAFADSQSKTLQKEDTMTQSSATQRGRHPAGDLTRDDVLDDFTLYWLTTTAVSAARFYWDLHLNLYNAANVSIPAAVSVFPGENYQAPRSWTEQAYHKLIYYNQVNMGGHAAWEQPRLFSEEARAGFKSLRSGAATSAA